MKKIVMIFERDFFRKNKYEAYGIDVLEKRGYDVELWSVAPWTHGWKKGEIPYYWGTNHVENMCVIYTEQEFNQKVDKLKEFCKPVFYIYPYHAYGLVSFKIRKKIKKLGFLFLNSTESPNIGNGTKIPPENLFVFFLYCVKIFMLFGARFLLNVLRCIKFWKGRNALLKQKVILQNLMLGFFGPLIYRSEYNFITSDLAFWGMPQFLEIKSKRNVFVDADYFCFVRDETKKFLDEPYIVFVDQGITSYELLPGDHIIVRDKDLFLTELNRFLDVLEKNTGMEVVIALHPKANYKTDIYNGRKCFCGVTNSLIKYSQFSVHSVSSSMASNVFYKKPIIFIRSNELVHPSWINTFNIIEDFFHTNVLNISEGCNDLLGYKCEITDEIYKKYVNLYMISDKADKKYFPEILADYAEKCFEKYE